MNILKKIARRFSDTNNLNNLENKTHISEKHLKVISDYSKDNNLFLTIRDLNPKIPEQMEKTKGNFIGKDLHIKFKSAVIPEIGGYIPIENRFSKKSDPSADKKMDALLSDQNSNYTSVPVIELVTKNNEETKFTLYYDTSQKENIFYYKNETNGKYYTSLTEDKEATINTNNLKEVRVLGNKEGFIVIPDYDLAIIGNNKKKTSSKAELDDDLGKLPIQDRKTIGELENLTDKMVRHSADNYNPFSYEFEMSKMSPYTCFLPNGNIQTASNPQEYLDIINQWRHADKNPNKQAYELILNPKLGVEVDKKGNIFLPKNRLDWKKIDEESSAIKNEIGGADNTEKKYQISNKLMTEKQFLTEKFELNQIINNEYERTKRIEMQEPLFKNTENYDLYKESLQNAKEGLKNMQDQYKNIFNEESIMRKNLNSLKDIRETNKQKNTPEISDKTVKDLANKLLGSDMQDKINDTNRGNFTQKFENSQSSNKHRGRG